MALGAAPVAAPTQAGPDQPDPGKQGLMPLEQLRRQPIASQLDIPYAAGDNPRQRLDFYRPSKPASSRLPVIVFLHGGGWRQGDKSDGAARLRPFVSSGSYAGVSVGYRLSGEAAWPAQIHDVKAAIRWVRANADGCYGLDPNRIAVWGRSAGAHLALMLGVTGDVPKLAGTVGPYDEVSSTVSGVANFFGVTDILAIIGQPSDIDRTSPQAPEAQLLGGPLLDNTERARAASPITYITRNDPPVLTIHGSADRTVPYDQAVRLHKALSTAGVRSYFITVPGAGHGGFPDEAVVRASAFFAKVLLGKDVTVPTEPLDIPGAD